MTEKDYLKRIYRLVKRLLKSFNTNNAEIESLKLKVIELEEKINNSYNYWYTSPFTKEIPQIPQFPSFPDFEHISNNPCEGCSNWEKVKNGEVVVCHCTVPYNTRSSITKSSIINDNSDLSNTLMQDFYKKENKNDK